MRHKKAGLAEHHGWQRASASLPCRQRSGGSRWPHLGWCGYLVPEILQALHAVPRRIAGDNRGIDRANGNSCYPVGQVFRGRQRFEDARLVASERAAALENQADFLVI